MPNSYVDIPADGVTTLFAFAFPYIDQSHISVLVDGVATSFTWSGISAVNVSPAPTSGANVRIIRTTPTDPVVDFQDGENLTEADLDNVNLQALYLSQEAADGLSGTVLLDDDGKLDAQSRVIKNVGTPTASDEAVNKAYADLVSGVDAQAQATAAAASAAAAAVSETNAAASEASAAASASAITPMKNTFVNSNTDYTTTTLQGNAAVSVAISDWLGIVSNWASGSDLLVSMVVKGRVRSTNGDDDLTGYLELRYQDAAGTMQTLAGVQDTAGAYVGMQNTNANVNSGGPYLLDRFQIPITVRLTDAERNQYGNWGVRLYGYGVADADSDVELTVFGVTLSTVEVLGGVS